MKRRDFLRTAVVGGAILAGGAGCVKQGSKTEIPATPRSNILSGIQIIDAHAHPDMDYAGTQWKDESSSYRYMLDVNMAASSFSAVGDSIFRSTRLGRSAFKHTKDQIDWWMKGIVRRNKVKLVLKSSDIPQQSDANQPLGAIISIEGGDALEGNLEYIDKFHKMGVRIITLMHFRNNAIGDIMKPYPGMEGTAGPYRGGLSEFGRDVIGKMEDVGMVVDVAHAHPTTFKEILSVAKKPVIDSHTNPSPTEEGINHGRMRTWK